ncbi:flippase [Candidatus Igneacidithiobacillus taiwanensis]|uniref:flippase n=1 Tax=Candidatus Igneacidithiobacillus taiwanensis TaxID=1945924 RepID=UPI0028A2A569|nr:flippase [Candidatus Igneacidithiobacillus taiwanensis]
MSTPQPRIARSTLINLAGAAVPAALLLITVPIYLHLIGEARYGVLAIVWLLLGYFGIFDLGFGRAVANRIAALRDAPTEKREEVFWTGWFISFITGLLGGLLLYAIGHWLFGNVFVVSTNLRGEVDTALPWLVFALPIATSLSLLAGTLEGRQAFLSMNLSQLAGTVTYQLLPLGIAYVGYNSLAVLIPAAIFGRLVSGLFLFRACKHHIPLQSVPRMRLSLVKPLLRYGGWITANGITSSLLSVADRFLIGSRIGMIAVTAYTIPYNIVLYFTIFPKSLRMALFPEFSRSISTDVDELLRRALLTVTILLSPLIILAELLAKPFLIFWIGKTLAQQSSPVAEILLLGVWLDAVSGISATYLQGTGRPDLPARFNLWELLPYMVMLWFGINYLGIVGAAWAWTIRVGVDCILLIFASKMQSIAPIAFLFFLPVVASFFLAQSLSYMSPTYIGLGALLLLMTATLSYTTIPKSWGDAPEKHIV